VTNIVRRDALLQRIDDSDCAVVVLNAPAGYGKSTLIMQMLEGVGADRDHCAAYYRFPQHGSDLQTLLQWLAAKLQSTRKSEKTLQTIPESDGSVFISRLLEKNPGDVTLVFDDFENCTNNACLTFIRSLVQERPPSLRLFISGRTVSALPLTKLWIAGDVLTLDKSDLQFSPKETEALFDESDRVNRLAVAKMEGWPTGLGLMARLRERNDEALRETFTARGFAKPLPTHVANVFDYFSEEVASSVSEDAQRLLATISVVDVVNGALAVALSDYESAPEVLQNLAEKGLFLDVIPGDEPYYRLHPVFREYATLRLCKRLGLDLAALNRKAALFFADNDNLLLALQHAAALGDVALADECARICRFADGGFRYPLDAWASLDHVADKEFRPYLAPLLGRCHLSMHRGEIERARKLLDWAKALLDASEDKKSQKHARTLCVSLSLLLGNYEAWPAAIKALREFEALDRDDAINKEPRQAALESEVVAWMCVDIGDFRKGAFLADRSAGVCARENLQFVWIYSLLAYATNVLELGQLENAQAAVAEASKISNDVLGPDANLTKATHLFAAAMSLESGRPIVSYVEVKKDIASILQGEIWSSLARQLVRLVGWGAHFHDGYEAGLAALDDLQVQLSSRAMRDWASVITQQKARLSLAAGEFDAASRHFNAAAPIEMMEDGLPNCDWQYQIIHLLAQAAIHIWAKRTKLAAAALDEAHAEIMQKAARKYETEYYILKAGLCRLQRKPAKVTEHLIQAMENGDDTGCVFAFVSHAKLFTELLNYIDENDAGVQRLALLKPKVQRIIADATKKPDTRSDDGARYPDALSPREGEVFKLLVGGMTSKEIANLLEISLNTVLGYRKSIYRKLGVSSRSMLVEIAKTLN